MNSHIKYLSFIILFIAFDNAVLLCISFALLLFTFLGNNMLRRGSVGRASARDRFSARHHREGHPTELSSDEEMERGPRNGEG